MNDEHDISIWFPDPLTDEAAFAIQLFLESFKLAFDEQYYAQIRRHIETVQQDYQMERRLDVKTDDDQQDDFIPF